MKSRKLIYQLFCGRLANANVLEHHGEVLQRMRKTFPWEKLRQDGFDGVYLFGLWNTIGPILVNDEGGDDISKHPNRTPSPFAITDHTLIHPELGSLEDFKHLINKIHQIGLHVIVDFVPNHTGLAHTWVKSHPEYYKNLSETAFSGDVVELNYDRPEVVEEMTSVLESIVSMGIDGFRCDMAHLVPVSFWSKAIPTVKQAKPDCVFLAEAYSSSVFDLSPQRQLLSAGFDAVYDEPLYRNTKTQLSSEMLTQVAAHLQYIASTSDANCWLHYCANHDDSFTQLPEHRLLWQVVFACLPGWQLVYNGFWNGQTQRLAHHWIEILETEYLPDQFTNPSFIRFVQWIHHESVEFVDVTVHDLTMVVNIRKDSRMYQILVDFARAVWHVNAVL